MSLRRVKSTPYFLAQGLNAPMLASVISMLDRAAPCFLSCFRLCWPWCSLVLPLAWAARILFQGRLQHLGGELARFHGQGYGFLVYFFLQLLSLLVKKSERQLRWNRQPPQVKGSHGWALHLPPTITSKVSVQAAVVVRQVKANVGAACSSKINAPCFGLRHIVRHKGRIVAVDGAGRVKKHGPQVLLDVADFGGVISQAVQDELDVMAVQLHKLGFHQLGGVIVPGNTDGLSGGAYGFQHAVPQSRPAVFIHFGVLNGMFIVDVVLDDFPINLYCAL